MSRSDCGLVCRIFSKLAEWMVEPDNSPPTKSASEHRFPEATRCQPVTERIYDCPALVIVHAEG